MRGAATQIAPIVTLTIDRSHFPRPRTHLILDSSIKARQSTKTASKIFTINFILTELAGSERTRTRRMWTSAWILREICMSRLILSCRNRMIKLVKTSSASRKMSAPSMEVKEQVTTRLMWTEMFKWRKTTAKRRRKVLLKNRGKTIPSTLTSIPVESRW